MRRCRVAFFFFFMACVYLPDASRHYAEPGLFDEALDHLSQGIDDMQSRRGHVCVLGDFNARPGKCRAHSGAHPFTRLAPSHGEDASNPQGSKLLALAARHGLRFISSQAAASSHPTFCRGVGDTRATSHIDFILVSQDHPAAKDAAYTLPSEHTLVQNCRTDHCPVIAPIMPALKAPHGQRRTEQRPRLESLKDEQCAKAYANFFTTAAPNWQAKLLGLGSSCSQTQVDDTYLELCSLMNAAVSGALGHRTVVKNITHRSLTKGTVALIAARRAVARIYNASPTPEHMQALLDAGDKARRATRKDKSRHKRARADKLNGLYNSGTAPKEMHDRIKANCPRQPDRSVPAAMRHPDTGQVQEGPEGVADSYAAFIHNLGKDTDTGDRATRAAAARREVAHISEHIEHDAVQDEPFTTREVSFRLRAMCNGKAAGLDNVAAELLKASGHAGVEMFTSLFNLVYATGRIPSWWRQGSIVPIFKKGDREDCGNYRPITLLRALDKLYASLLAQRLDRVVPNEDEQYGFCKGRGTAESHFNLLTAIENAFECGSSLHMLSLDIRKAFDTVCRAILLVKLHKHGVRGNLWLAIKSLYDRTEASVSCAGATSERFEISKGVAQGCPLSPKLFNVYLKDLIRTLDDIAPRYGVVVPGTRPGNNDRKHTAGSAFADDTKALSALKAALEATGRRMLEEVELLNMDTAPQKSAYIHFTKANTEGPGVQEVQLGDHTVAASTVLRDLGILFCPDLSWVPQISKAVGNTRFGLYNYQSLLRSPKLNFGLKRLIIKTYIVPIMRFGMEIWFPTSRPEREAFRAGEGILIRALQMVLGVGGRARWHLRRALKAEVLLSDFGLPSLATENKAAHVRFAYKHNASGSFADPPPAADSEARADHPVLLPDLPWSRRTAHIEQQRRRSVVRAAGGTATNTEVIPAPDERPSNRAITATLHQQALLESLETHAPQECADERSAGHGHNLRSKAGGGNKDPPGTNLAGLVYTEVFKTRSGAVKKRFGTDVLSEMSYLGMSTRDDALAIAALRSGHLLDDYYVNATQGLSTTASIRDGCCSCCGLHVRHLPQHGQCLPRELPWLLILHRLLDCSVQATTAGPNRRPTALCHFADTLRALAAPSSGYYTFVSGMLSGLHDCDEQVSLCARQDFLTLLVAPTNIGGPPVRSHEQLFGLVADLLCARTRASRHFPGDTTLTLDDPVPLNPAPPGAEADAPPG